MINRILTAGTVAGTTLLSPLAGAAGAQPADEQTDEADERHCILQADAQGVVDESTARCYPTLAEATAARAPRSILVARHYEHSNGTPTDSSWDIYHTSCSTTRYPTSWWRTHMSSTMIGSSCSGAKHYTGTNCSGSYQIADAPSPTITALNATLNDNVGCVKYA